MLSTSTLDVIQSIQNPVSMYRLYDLGGIIRLTDAPNDVIFTPASVAQVYYSVGLQSSSSIANKEGSKIGNFSIKGVLTKDIRYSSFEALRGLDVTVYLFIPATDDGETDFTPVIFKGKVGITTLEGGSRFSIEVVSRLAASDSVSLPQIGPNCILTLGSQRCSIDTGLYSMPFTITSTPNPRGVFRINTNTPVPPVGYFTLGKCRFYGAPDISQAGIIADILSAPGGWEIRLLVPLEIYLDVGMTGILTPGCDKTVLTCSNKFNNLVNHLGAPGLPNINKRLRGT